MSQGSSSGQILGCKHLSPLSHLTGPNHLCRIKEDEASLWVLSTAVKDSSRSQGRFARLEHKLSEDSFLLTILF